MADGVRGLTETEAAARLHTEGYNELPRAQQRTIPRIALEVLKEPMFGLSIASGAIYFFLGDLQEAVLLLAFATISVGIAIVQESRSENVLKALRDMTSPRALVIRDGVRRRVPGREVARGDVHVLSEGDRVPADRRLLTSDDLLIDESLLTGESVPVRKLAGNPPHPARPGGDDLHFVFCGSLVVRGQGVVEITSLRNPALWMVMGVALPLLVAAVSWAPAEALFRFGPLHMDDLAICLVTALVLLGALEVLKRLWKARLVT